MRYIIIDLIIFGIILILNAFLFLVRRKKKKLIKNKSSKYAIIIPARDESVVIRKSLESIKKQNKNMDNVYVIIESKKDPTFNIAKEFGANVYVRKKPIIHTKGNALDECFKYIFASNKHYDLYFIFDADNIMGKNFIKTMLNYWKSGYEITTAHRSTSNPSTWVSLCSGLLFSAQNVLFNEYRNLFNQPVTLSGSGFYIDGRIIEKMGGFPFHSLTEDFELSVYIEDINAITTYAKDCIYYDEQPLTLKASINQRVRWLKGIFDNTKKRKKDIVTIYSTLILSLDAILVILIVTELIIVFGLIRGILLSYALTSLATLIALIFDNNRINFNLYQKIKCIIFNPFFIATYVVCLPKALFKKKIVWDKTRHFGSK